MNYLKLLLISSLFISCLGNPSDSYDLAYDFEGFEQEISLPLFKQTHTAEYILAKSLDDSNIISDENNFMSLAYEMDSFSSRGDETIKLDSLNFDMPQPEVRVPHNLKPNLLPAPILSIKEGDVTLHFLVGHQEDIQVEFTIEEISLDGQTWKQTFDIQYPGFIPTTIDKCFSLADHDIDLSSGNFNVAYRAYNSNMEEKLLGEVSLRFSEQYCQKVIASDLEAFNFDAVASAIPISFYKNGISNEVDLASVNLNLEFDNSFGFPMRLNELNIVASNNAGSNLNLTSPLLQNLTLEFPTMTEIGESKKTSFIFDEDNSNLLDLLNMGPDQLTFNFVAGTEESNNASDSFFALDSSQIKANLELEIPMELSLKSFAYTEKQEFDLNLAPLPEFEGHSMTIDNLSLQLKAINNLPISMQVQYYFLDEEDNILDSLFTEGRKEIGSADLDSNFEVISATEWLLIEEINNERLNLIQTATHIRSDYIARSGIEGELVIKLYNTDNIEFQLGATAAVRYE